MMLEAIVTSLVVNRTASTCPPDADTARIASYLAKYSIKTTDGSKDFAQRFSSQRQIEQLKDSHQQRLALTAWELSRTPEFNQLRLHRHAHTLGYRGQIITKSRKYSTTFSALRSARADYMAQKTNSKSCPAPSASTASVPNTRKPKSSPNCSSRWTRNCDPRPPSDAARQT
jgi:hypothetical protein